MLNVGWVISVWLFFVGDCDWHKTGIDLNDHGSGHFY